MTLVLNGLLPMKLKPIICVHKNINPKLIYIPCSFRRWNLGEPRKLFLIVVNLDRQWCPVEWGEPGGVIGPLTNPVVSTESGDVIRVEVAILPLFALWWVWWGWCDDMLLPEFWGDKVTVGPPTDVLFDWCEWPWVEWDPIPGDIPPLDPVDISTGVIDLGEFERWFIGDIIPRGFVGELLNCTALPVAGERVGEWQWLPVDPLRRALWCRPLKHP